MCTSKSWVQKIEPQWHEKRKCIYYSLKIMLYNSRPECTSIQKTISLLALLNTECRQWNLGVWKKMKNANNWGKKHLKLKKNSWTDWVGKTTFTWKSAEIELRSFSRNCCHSWEEFGDEPLKMGWMSSLSFRSFVNEIRGGSTIGSGLVRCLGIFD